MSSRKKFSQAQNAPFTIKVKPGRYLWCSCGESKKQPFCDGNHEATGMFPLTVHFKEEQTIHFCGCKSTENPPFCDGTHQKFINE